MNSLKSSFCLITLLSAILCFNTGCQLVYKHEMNQGNIIPEEKVAELKPGLSMAQVHFLLGTPILDNYFHQDRWDYIYYLKPGYGEAARKHLIIYFNDEKVSSIVWPA